MTRQNISKNIKKGGKSAHNAQKRAVTKKVVTIGGGTGSYTVLSGLKHFVGPELDVKAVISVSDSGGSTGRLRDEFGYLPVGDFRMALVALASNGNGASMLRDLFQYRFSHGEGLEGHSFGNLFLTAMRDVAGSEKRAIQEASRILRVKGEVIPVSSDDVQLVAEYENGVVVEGERHIDTPPEEQGGKERIVDCHLNPKAKITDDARKAIEEAGLIVLGPGDLYTSTIANLAVTGVKEAIKKNRGKVVYVMNLMTRHGQTPDFSARDFVSEIERYMERPVDHILINTTPFPADILSRYEKEDEYPVKNDIEDDGRVLFGDLLAPKEVERKPGDTVRRSLLRHDSRKLAHMLYSLV